MRQRSMRAGRMWVCTLACLLKSGNRPCSVCTQIDIAMQDQRPSYKDLQELLRETEGSSSGKTWVERIKSEFAFNRDSLDDFRR